MLSNGRGRCNTDWQIDESSMRKTRLVISKTYNGSFFQYGFAFISENNEHSPLLLDQVHKFPHMGKFKHLIRIIIYALDPTGLYPSPCTLPSSVHCPIHLHTGPAPSVYTAFLLMPCQLRFEPATMVWGKFCTCCCLGENFALVPFCLI